MEARSDREGEDERAFVVAVAPYARAGLAFAAFLLLFFAIVNISAGRYALSGATFLVGLVATLYIVWTRQTV